MVASLLICSGASVGVSSSTQRRMPSRICLESNAESGGRAVIHQVLFVGQFSGETRRRHEAAKILLDQFSEFQGRAVLEPCADQLDANRQSFWRQADGDRGRGQAG